MDAVEALQETLRQLTAMDVKIPQLRFKTLTRERAFDGGDYDFFAAPGSRLTIKKTFQKTIRARCGSFCIKANPSKIQIDLWDSHHRRHLSVDIWTEYRIFSDEEQQSYFVRFSDIAHLLLQDNGGYALPIDLEAVLYINHLDTKKRDVRHQEVQDRLKYYSERLHASDPAAAGRLWSGKAEGEEMPRRIQRHLNDLRDMKVAPSSLASAYMPLLRSLGLLAHRRPAASDLRNRLPNAIRHRVEARLHTPFAAVVGPDGAGKSTFISALTERFDNSVSRRTFKNFFRLNRLYRSLRHRSRTYQRSQTNIADERYGRLLFWLALINYVRHFKAGGPNCGLVVVDRFFHDLLLHNVRAARGRVTLGAVGRVQARLFPLPAAVFHLYAPVDTIRRRKAELEEETIREYEEHVEHIYLTREPSFYVQVCTADSVETNLKFVDPILKTLTATSPHKPWI